MKNKHGLKIAISIASLGILFIGLYQFAFASTFGGGLLFQSDQNSKSNHSSAIVQTNSNLVQTSATSNGEITFTAEELAQYNGMNGNPAYVAVDGIVYDMTKIGAWRNGQHQGLSAGQDLSAAFAGSPHSKNILNQSPIVGKFVTTKTPVTVVDSTTTATVPNSSTPVVGSTTGSNNNGNNGNSGLITLAQTSTVAVPKTWTLDALSKYNGMNGNPAYIAVSGTIYDVTNIGSWSSGVHHGIHAGQDVTNFFANSPHSTSLLKQLPVVGKIGGTIASNNTTPNPAVDTTTSATTLGNSNSNGYSNNNEYDEHEDDSYKGDHEDEHEDGDD